jgi:DNA-binding beta-propeller fold protein YncE
MLVMAASPTARSVEFFDAHGHGRVDGITGLIAQPHEIGWDPVARMAYLTHTYRDGAYGGPHPKGHEISVIDVDRRKLVRVIDTAPYYAPHDIAVNSSGTVFAGIEMVGGVNGLLAIDPVAGQVVDVLPLGAPDAHWIALADDPAKLYVTHKDAPHLSIVDTSAFTLAGTLHLPGGAEEVDVSPDGRWVFVVTPRFERSPERRGPSRLVTIDTFTDRIVDSLEFAHYNVGVHVAADLTVLVTSTEVAAESVASSDEASRTRPGGIVSIVDGNTMRLRAPDSGTAWVASLGTGNVTVIDLGRLAPVAELECARDAGVRSAHGLCVVTPVASP